jgi:hypothetical protein
VLAYLRRHHMGLIALFIALGGTSYAATQLPPNSVGTTQIRARAVTGAKIHNGAITSAKLSPALNALQGRSAALAYGYYAAPQPCIPTSGIACPSILIVVGALSRAVNVSLASPSAAAASGFVCLALAPDIDASKAVVVTAPDGGPNGTAVTAVDHAEWVAGAPNCAPGQVEVDTYYVTSDGSGQHVTRRGLPFAFAVF